MENENKIQNEGLSEAARDKRREYYRAWVAKNRERKRKLNRDYWERQAAKMQEGDAAK